MADSLHFLECLSPSITVSTDTSLALAKKALVEQGADFLIIEGSAVTGLMSAEQLVADRSASTCLLSELPELPPLVTLAASWEVLSSEQVDSLYEALNEIGAQGMLVYDHDELLGVLAAEALESAEVSRGIVRVSKGALDGTSSVSFQIYSCEVCSSMRIPATGEDTPPTCPKESSHGPMALE